jgi:hypothetical protein
MNEKQNIIAENILLVLKESNVKYNHKIKGKYSNRIRQIDVYIEDSFGQVVQLTFAFNNENEKEEQKE